MGNTQQPPAPSLTNHSKGEGGGWELGFSQIAGVGPDNSKQNLTLGAKREQIKIPFRKGEMMFLNSFEGTRRTEQEGRGGWEWGGRASGLRISGAAALPLAHSQRWKRQYWQTESKGEV